MNERERGLRFDNGTWTDVGDAVDYRGSQERDELLDLLAAEGTMTVAQIARSLGLKYNTALRRLHRATDAGQTRKTEDGKYAAGDELSALATEKWRFRCSYQRQAAREALQTLASRSRRR